VAEMRHPKNRKFSKSTVN